MRYKQMLWGHYLEKSSGIDSLLSFSSLFFVSSLLPGMWTWWMVSSCHFGQEDEGNTLQSCELKGACVPEDFRREATTPVWLSTSVLLHEREIKNYLTYASYLGPLLLMVEPNLNLCNIKHLKWYLVYNKPFNVLDTYYYLLCIC